MEFSVCDLCGGAMAPHQHYVVRIDVFADPTLPAVSSAELAASDLDAVMDKLLAEMKGLSTDELQDQVHRRFEFKICPMCQPKFLANPLGKPRRQGPGEN
ncbi:MAG: hypothetical protein ABR964_10245 [Tepidisphaeraceae bacterium]|jgi:hypothetical protein